MAKHPARMVEFAKVKAVSRTFKLPEFWTGVITTPLLLILQLNVQPEKQMAFPSTKYKLCMKQNELGNVVGLYHSFLARDAEHKFDKKGYASASRFDMAILDASSACLSHIAIVDDDIAHQCPIRLRLCYCPADLG